MISFDDWIILIWRGLSRLIIHEIICYFQENNNSFFRILQFAANMDFLVCASNANSCHNQESIFHLNQRIWQQQDDSQCFMSCKFLGECNSKWRVILIPFFINSAMFLSWWESKMSWGKLSQTVFDLVEAFAFLLDYMHYFHEHGRWWFEILRAFWGSFEVPGSRDSH